MNVPYETLVTDFYHRDDGSGTAPLACSAHLHRHIEFFYLRSGRCRATVDSVNYIVEPGDMLIAFPNQVHRYDTLEKESYELFIVHPDRVPEWENILAGRLPEAALIKHAEDDRTLMQLLEMLKKSDAQGAWREMTLRGLLLAFFGQLLSHVKLTDSHTQDSRALREIVDYCTRNFTSELSLESLEEELHLSRYYISHLFGNKLNIHFNDYVNSLRVSDACRLLRQTDMSMTEISAQAGFCTLRTFNRSFMKQMGQSPSDYRKGVRNEKRTCGEI